MHNTYQVLRKYPQFTLLCETAALTVAFTLLLNRYGNGHKRSFVTHFQTTEFPYLNFN